MKEFALYLDSPLFNKNSDVLNLQRILHKYHPGFDARKITHEQLSKALFGKTDIQRLRYVMTDLTKLALQFIALKQTQADTHIHVIKALKQRNLGKQFVQELDKTKKRNAAHNLRDENYYANMHALSELSFQFTLAHDNRNIDTQLQELVDNLDSFYLIKKLKYSCEIINRMNILNVQYDVQLLENLLDFLTQQKEIKLPAINTYFHVLKTLQEPQIETHYHELKRLIHAHLHYFSSEDQYDLFGYLQNYCIKKINTGSTNYLNELFSNYQEMIANHVVIKNGLIDQFDFKNIVTVALRVEAYQWTANFIATHQSYLPPEHAENAITYNKARLYFHQKKYKQSRKELLSVEFTDVYYGLDSRSLLLKTYFEMEDYESALSLINAFKIYLKRDKKISEYQNKTYSGFLKIATKMVRYKLGYKVSIAMIQKEVESAKEVADLSWLKTQLGNLG